MSDFPISEDIEISHYLQTILSIGNWSSCRTSTRGDIHFFVPVRLQNLIEEIRFAPVDEADLESNIKKLLAGNGLSILVNPAALGIKKA